ncbi:hypothetical protein JTE90_026095 [Oedothorax gibbosus]|uniref:Uncharacterized protein n=1 Tax=Oedothorax gibbosus TaxID=931172 RepID=A0AAV6TIL4_9ARAC|nr:hypothetical protein JTE90_026095 [Oedothorax gibbosus]
MTRELFLFPEWINNYRLSVLKARSLLGLQHKFQEPAGYSSLRYLGKKFPDTMQQRIPSEQDLPARKAKIEHHHSSFSKKTSSGKLVTRKLVLLVYSESQD